MDLSHLVTPAAMGLFLMLTAAAAAADLDVEQALRVPGLRQLLPPGTVPGPSAATDCPVAVGAWGLPAETSGGPERTAVLVVGPFTGVASSSGVGVGTGARLVLIRHEKSDAAVEVDHQEAASGADSVVLDRVGPDGGAALAVHWSSPEGPDGKLVVWALGEGKAEVALETVCEGFTFDFQAGASPTLVAYESEEGSLVRLPSLYEWQGRKLVQARQAPDGLTARLLTEYDEVLGAFEASGARAVPNRMVVDVALLKARLLERSGKRREALAAYEFTAALASVETTDPNEQAELLERASEARRRAGVLR